MEDHTQYPGTPQHQALLAAVAAFYAYDPRVLAVLVFGSLGRGDWDAYSDLDLDVILADGVVIDAASELARLCRSFGSATEMTALIIPDGSEGGDVVLDSLMQLSVRYHPLYTTSPNIVDSMRVLTGHLDPAAIAAAGRTNQAPSEPPLARLLDECVRYAAVANVQLQRQRFWLCVEVFHRMRRLLMELYRRTHNGQRVEHCFESAPDDLQARLRATLPDGGLPDGGLSSLQAVLRQFIDILEGDLSDLSGGQLELSTTQRSLLQAIARDALPAGGAP